MISGLFRQLIRQTSLRAVAVEYSSKAADPTNPSNSSDKDVRTDEDEDKVNVADYIIDDEETENRAAYIEKIRNRSGLRDKDRRRLLDRVPYDEPQSWIHLTLEYQRKMYGRYGATSGVDPRLLFQTPEELADRAEYERVAHPKTLQQMVAEEMAAADAKVASTRKREEDIAKKLAKLDQWTNELNARVAKKEADARAAKEKRERLIEEVRRQFGFRLDHRDPRFQELLDQKEAEDKKASKALKKQKKQEIALKKLQEQFDSQNNQLKRPDDVIEQTKGGDDATKKSKK